MNNILETIQEDNLFLADYTSGNCHIQPSKFAKDIKDLKLNLLKGFGAMITDKRADYWCSYEDTRVDQVLSDISQEIQDVKF